MFHVHSLCIVYSPVQFPLFRTGIRRTRASFEIRTPIRVRFARFPHSHWPLRCRAVVRGWPVRRTHVQRAVRRAASRAFGGKARSRRPVDAKRERNSGTPARREERRPTGTRHAATAAETRPHRRSRQPPSPASRRRIHGTRRGAVGGAARARERHARPREFAAAELRSGAVVRLRRQQPPRSNGKNSTSPRRTDRTPLRSMDPYTRGQKQAPSTRD